MKLFAAIFVLIALIGFSACESNDDTMTVIFAKIDGSFFTLTISPNDTILQVKQQLGLVEKMAPSEIGLSWGGKGLEDFWYVRDIGFKNKSTIHLIKAIRGA
ncbi:hypothetical protein HDE_09820 [Halotydeus destructor]|nr:hypothetical protein HDE_09820 [Halotydeus destructor]